MICKFRKEKDKISNPRQKFLSITNRPNRVRIFILNDCVFSKILKKISFWGLMMKDHKFKIRPFCIHQAFFYWLLLKKRINFINQIYCQVLQKRIILIIIRIYGGEISDTNGWIIMILIWFPYYLVFILKNKILIKHLHGFLEIKFCLSKV